MRTLTHYRFAQTLLPLLPKDPSLRRAFLLGCVEPDINLLSHLDLNRQTKALHLHGHNHPYLDRRIQRLSQKLASCHSITPLYTFRLGVLLHYLADAFTFAHNTNFRGNFAAHNAYENTFHRYFEKKIERLPKEFWQKAQPFHYPKMRESFLKQKPSLSRDFSFILLATRSALHTFLPNNKILR